MAKNNVIDAHIFVCNLRFHLSFVLGESLIKGLKLVGKPAIN